MLKKKIFGEVMERHLWTKNPHLFLVESFILHFVLDCYLLNEGITHENMFFTIKTDGKLMKLFYVTLVQEYNFKKITLNVHCSLC